MTPYTTDTDVDAETVQLELLRKMSPQKRAAKAIALSGQVIRMAKAAIRRQFPHFTEEQVGIKFIEVHYGEELASAVETHLQGRKS